MNCNESERVRNEHDNASVGHYPEVKRPGRDANLSPPSNAKFKNTWIYTSTPPYVFMVKHKQTNSVAPGRKRTISTERPSLVGEVSVNFWGYTVSRGQRDGSLWLYSRLSRSEKLLPLLSSSSVVLTRLWNLFTL
jgi:hypothetical protein